MNGFGGGFSGGPGGFGRGGGFDWNGNGSRDAFDGYMDYKASGSDKGGGHNSGGGNGGGGCLSTIVSIGILFFFVYLLGSCS